MRPRTVFALGVVLGAILGFSYLAAGPLILVPGLVLVRWLLIRGHPLAGLAGSVLGFGAMWVVLIGLLLNNCANDPTCVVPDGWPWLAVGAVIAAAGLALSATAGWQARQG